MGTLTFWCARLRVAPTLFALICALVLAYPGWSMAQPLGLSDAFTRAANADPAFSAADARINAASAGIRQADTRPNPSVEFELENFVGTGPFGAFNESHTTLSYSQPIERGNKREARTLLARAGLRTAEIEKRVYALDLFERVEIAWVEAVAAEAAIGLSEERLAAARRLREETQRRVQAAREPEFAGARVAALVAETEIEFVHAQNNARTTKASLTGYWDDPEDFQLDPVWLDDLDVNLGSVLDDSNIDLALVSAERQRAGAQVTLEESRAVQDPTFSGGVRHFALGNDLALVAGVAISLPLYNDNSGNISRAMAERSAAGFEYAALRRNLQREFTTLGARIGAHIEEAQALQDSAIPEAERALSLIQEGFDRGAFEYIDIIDAERNLNNARTRRLDILREYHLDVARLHRLTGRHMSIATIGEAR